MDDKDIMKLIRSGAEFRVGGLKDVYFFGVSDDFIEVKWEKRMDGIIYSDNTFYPVYDVIDNIRSGAWIIDKKYYRKLKLEKLNESR